MNYDLLLQIKPSQEINSASLRHGKRKTNRQRRLSQPTPFDQTQSEPDSASCFLILADALTLPSALLVILWIKRMPHPVPDLMSAPR